MTEHPQSDFSIDEVMIRPARAEDADVLRELFVAGLLEGQVHGSDTGADIENFVEAYLSDGGQSCFWVAEHRARVIGMIGVQHTGDETAEIRRLRVHLDYRRRGIGSKLMAEAIAFCKRLGYLKVVLDVRVERGPAIAMFQKFGFRLARTRNVTGRTLVDFYLDLYRERGA